MNDIEKIICEECSNELINGQKFMVCSECGLESNKILNLYGTSMNPSDGYIMSGGKKIYINSFSSQEKELEIGHKINPIKFPGTLNIPSRDLKYMHDKERKKWESWKVAGIDKQKQSVFSDVEDFLEKLDLSTIQKLNLKTEVSKLNIKDIEIALEYLIKTIIKFNYPVIIEELYQTIRYSQEDSDTMLFTSLKREQIDPKFKSLTIPINPTMIRKMRERLIKKIGYPKRNYSWYVFLVINVLKKRRFKIILENHDTHKITNEFLKTYKDISRYTPKEIRKRILAFLISDRFKKILKKWDEIEVS